ncbi:MAG: FKBP-type peptidyl-prolyl cis-trans isomerase [Bacteroidales bacterium]
MKKITVLPLLAAGALALTLSSCGGGKQTASLKTDIDSVSYAIGVNTGLSYKQNLESFPGGKANVDDMIAGFANALKGDTTLTQEQAINIIQNYFQGAEKKEADKNLAEGQKFLDENKSKDGIVTTASGLQYKVDSLGTGATPTASDVVKVHYTGKLLDGTVFDSSVERGEPATFGVGQVIAGWTEALQLMPVGSKYTLYIPADLAYGDRQAGPKIKPNSTLVFEVELLGIEKQADAKK